MNGKGVLISKTGSKYEGDFKDGLMQGHGVMMDKSGGIY